MDFDFLVLIFKYCDAKNQREAVFFLKYICVFVLLLREQQQQKVIFKEFSGTDQPPNSIFVPTVLPSPGQ